MQKFGDDLDEARLAMEALAKAYPKKQLESEAFSLYEKFRPKIPEGTKGWGAKGDLDLDFIRSLAKWKAGYSSYKENRWANFVIYGWKPDLSDEEILEKLLALNLDGGSKHH